MVNHSDKSDWGPRVTQISLFQFTHEKAGWELSEILTHQPSGPIASARAEARLASTSSSSIAFLEKEY